MKTNEKTIKDIKKLCMLKKDKYNKEIGGNCKERHWKLTGVPLNINDIKKFEKNIKTIALNISYVPYILKK